MTDPSRLAAPAARADAGQRPLLAGGVRAVLYLAVFLGGAILMSLEILAFRLIGKTFGLALRETSVVIAVFLTAMSVGYYFGGRWGDRWPRVRLLAGMLFVAGASALVIPRLDFLVSPWVFESTLPLAIHSTLVTTLLFSLPIVCLAGVTPIAVRLLSADVRESGRVAGSVSALSTAGSILGSVATAFVLIDLFGSVSWTIRLLAVAALLLAGGLAVARLYDPAALGGRPADWLARHPLVGTLAAILAGAAVVGASIQAWARPVENVADERFRLGEVVFERDSAFHHITVVDRERTRSLYFKREETQSAMSLDDPYAGALEYTDYFHIPMLLVEDVRSALFIGLGGGSVPKRFARDYPGVEVDVVEIDPAVVDVARRYFHLETGPRLRVHELDGRVFLKRSTRSWDVIGVDAYTTNAYGSTMPAHLVTREFFAEVAAHLTADGYLVFNVAAPLHTPVSRAVSRTLAEVFPRQMVFAGTTGNTVFVAGKGESWWKREDVVARARAALASGRVKLASIEQRAGRLLTATLPIGDAPLLTDDSAPIDALMRASRRFGVGVD